MERELAVEDVAAGEGERLLEIVGSVDVLVEDERLDVGGVLGEGVDDDVEELGAPMPMKISRGNNSFRMPMS